MNTAPLHVNFRRYSREILNKTLSFFFKKPSTNKKISLDNVQTVVIIRPNYRIGNLIFLTPLINEIYLQNNNIKIDLIVGMEKAKEIFEPMQSIDKVISIPREFLLKPLKLLNLIQTVRKKRYDICLNIVSGSVSSQIVTSFINAKYKISFEDKKSWTTLTNEVTPANNLIHSALSPLGLLSACNINSFKTELILDIKLKENELKKAHTALYKITNKKTIAIFRGARYEKKLSDNWWSELVDALLNEYDNIEIIDILSPDVPKRLNNRVKEYSNKNLRELCAFFGVCNLYISADTGPLHLAAASKTSCCGLFNHTNPDSYGLLGSQNKNININNLSSQEIVKLINFR